MPRTKLTMGSSNKKSTIKPRVSSGKYACLAKADKTGKICRSCRLEQESIVNHESSDSSPDLKLHSPSKARLKALLDPDRDRHLVFCPSKGREVKIKEKQWIINKLRDKDDFFVFFIVDQMDFERYIEAFGENAFIIGIPSLYSDNPGTSRWVAHQIGTGRLPLPFKGHWKTLSIPYYYQVDDNIAWIRRSDGKKQDPATALRSLKTYQDLEHCALLGMTRHSQYSQHTVAQANAAKGKEAKAKPIEVQRNNGSFYKLMLVNTKLTKDVDYIPGMKFGEDVVFMRLVRQRLIEISKQRDAEYHVAKVTNLNFCATSTPVPRIHVYTVDHLCKPGWFHKLDAKFLENVRIIDHNDKSDQGTESKAVSEAPLESKTTAGLLYLESISSCLFYVHSVSRRPGQETARGQGTVQGAE